MTFVAFIFAGAGFFATPDSPGDPAEIRAREIVEKAIAAKGGKENVQKFPAWRFKYKETFRTSANDVVETGEAIEHPAANQARYESSDGPTVIINGEQGWIKGRDGKVVFLDKAHVADFESFLKGKDGLIRVLPLLHEDWVLRHDGEKTIDGKVQDVIRVRWKDRWSALTYWDRATHLLTQAEYEHKRLIEPDPKLRKTTNRKLLFGDYQTVGKTVFHTKVTTFIADRPIGEVHLFAIEMLMNVPEQLFAPPR